MRNEISCILNAMNLDDAYEPEYESLKKLLTDMAQERSVDVLLDLIVDRMAMRPHVALVRIWLKKEGDICPDCPAAPHCTDRAFCLHLAAGRGSSITSPPHNFSDLSGHAARIPISHTGVGRVALTGRPLSPEEIRDDPDWKARETWARGENILGFGAKPLTFKDETFGVIAVYSRIKAGRIREGRFWLAMIANHAASAIANARAFAEISRLKSRLELENACLREEINRSHVHGNIIGKSPALKNVLAQISLVAPTDAGVLILGESGTGKELAAREIHRLSRRHHRPLIQVNCAAIPGDLYESEFFGHVQGAFTGAVRDRAGRFQAADRGTLFLDEVGELPLGLQGKLLRVLQEGTYERIGEEKTRKADVRIIAATNRDIRADVASGRFRGDLFYRLSVFPIEMAPLRARPEDIPLLAHHFMEKIAFDMNRELPRIPAPQIERLKRYAWPGNVRELKNAVERAIITSHRGVLSFGFLEDTDGPESDALPAPPAGTDRTVMSDREMNQLVRENICNALLACKGRIYGPEGAAALLGCAPTTLGSRIKKNGIDIRGYR